MHIVLFHDAVIPPKAYGGTERVVADLASTLVSFGHQVSLLAKKGSHIDGANLIEVQSERWMEAIPSSADLIHLWAPVSSYPKKPFIITIEGNGKPGESFHPNTVFVSSKHAALHGSQHFVYNGINTAFYTADKEREDYLVFLAKASWAVKNLEGALAIAKASHLPIKILGSRNWPFRLNQLLRKKFSTLWPRNIEYWGMVGDQEKKEVLRKARGLVFPVRWHEPFGLAITEALASGCPVFGTPYGSLPEIVTPSVGHLSASVQDLADAILKKTYNPDSCRQRVFEGFTREQMTTKYLSYYENLLKSGTLTGEKQTGEYPKTLSTFSATALLPWQN